MKTKESIPNEEKTYSWLAYINGRRERMLSLNVSINIPALVKGFVSGLHLYF